MDRHPIQGIMDTTMEHIRDMVDVNTVLGEAITAQDGSMVLPVSRVSFGFAAGGGEYQGRAGREDYPFAGGAGAGVTIQPVGFLVLGESHVRVLPAQTRSSADRMIDLIPGVMEEFKNALSKIGGKGACPQSSAGKDFDNVPDNAPGNAPGNANAASSGAPSPAADAAGSSAQE